MQNSFLRRHRRWLERLGIADRPWLVLGSAPDPTIPTGAAERFARIDVNNSGRTAASLGFGRADLTVRAHRKKWEGYADLDTCGLLWIHTTPSLFLRFRLRGQPHRHVGSLRRLRKEEREDLVSEVARVPLATVGDFGKVSNGVAAVCYGLVLGVPEIVVAGVSLSETGHSYDALNRRRLQVDEDRTVLARLAADRRVATTEPGLARDTGLRLWTP